MTDTTGLSGWGAGSGFATGGMPAGPAGPQPIWNDPSAGFSRMGEAFGQLPMNPMFMGSLAMLTNEGRMTPGIMQSMLGMQALHDRRSLSKEEQRRYEREMKNMEKSQAALEKILTRSMGGAQQRPTNDRVPAVPAGEAAGPFSAALPAALQGPLYGFGESQAARYHSSLFPPTQAPAAAPVGPMAGAAPMGPRGGATPMSLPLGGIQQPPPFEGAPAGSGAPAGAAPLSSRDDQQAAVALALMGGSRQDRAQGINILANMLSRKPEERRILEDAAGRKRYVDTGELVFDLPEPGPEKVLPYRGKSPTEWQAGVNAMWEASTQGTPLAQDQDMATRFAAKMFGLVQDKPFGVATPAGSILKRGGIGMRGAANDFFEGASQRAMQATIRETPPEKIREIAPAALATPAPEPKSSTALRWAPSQVVPELPAMRSASLANPSSDFVPRQLSESESKNMRAIPQVLEAVVSFEQLESAGFAPDMLDKAREIPVAGEWAIGPATQLLSSEETATQRQQFDIARSKWGNAVTRVDSGANVTEREFEQELKKYAPTINDTDFTRAEKAYYRARTLRKLYDQFLMNRSSLLPPEEVQDFMGQRSYIDDYLIPRAKYRLDQMKSEKWKKNPPKTDAEREQMSNDELLRQLREMEL